MIDEELIARAERAYTQWPLDIKLIRELTEECKALNDELESTNRMFHRELSNAADLTLRIQMLEEAIRHALEAGVKPSIGNRLRATLDARKWRTSGA